MRVASLASAVVLLLTSALASAQNSTSSPYSMYGIGIVSPKEDAAVAGMGHAGIAVASNEFVNITNPAALCKLDSLAFYFNVQLKGFYAREENVTEHQSVYSANIDGISMAFRGRRWLAFAVGYAPYSTVGYSMSEIKNIVGTDYNYTIQHKGSGGLSQAFINASVTLFNHLTLGGNFSVLWGTIEKLEIAYFSDVIGGEDIYNSRKYSVNNIFYELGLQYDFNIGKYNNFRIGGIFNKKTWLHTSYDQVVYNSVSRELDSDDSTPERFYVPRTYGFGLTYQRKAFMGTIEYKVEEWGDVPNTKFKESVNYRDTHRIAGGLQYSPGHPDDPFYKRMRYRIGGYYGKDYLDLTTADLKQSGFTLGITVPVGRSANAVTIAYEYQKRGTTNNGMVKETFNNLKLCFNIREVWFVKSKFD